MTPAGIEPATFRFVAQHLNHYATAVPLSVGKPSKKQKQIIVLIIIHAGHILDLGLYYTLVHTHD